MYLHKISIQKHTDFEEWNFSMKFCHVRKIEFLLEMQ